MAGVWRMTGIDGVWWHWLHTLCKIVFSTMATAFHLRVPITPLHRVTEPRTWMSYLTDRLTHYRRCSGYMKTPTLPAHKTPHRVSCQPYSLLFHVVLLLLLLHLVSLLLRQLITIRMIKVMRLRWQLLVVAVSLQAKRPFYWKQPRTFMTKYRPRSM